MAWLGGPRDSSRRIRLFGEKTGAYGTCCKKFQFQFQFQFGKQASKSPQNVGLYKIVHAIINERGRLAMTRGEVQFGQFGTHHVGRGVWNAWVCACANHTYLTGGTRRKLGFQINWNEELVNIHRQTLQKSPHEVN
jgi:hypothetical protein